MGRSKLGRKREQFFSQSKKITFQLDTKKRIDGQNLFLFNRGSSLTRFPFLPFFVLNCDNNKRRVELIIIMTEIRSTLQYNYVAGSCQFFLVTKKMKEKTRCRVLEVFVCE